jgi:hypothetical protein
MANVGGDCGIAAITETQQFGGNKCSDLHHGRFTSKNGGQFSQKTGMMGGAHCRSGGFGEDKK